MAIIPQACSLGTLRGKILAVEAILKFLREVRLELSKVEWPNRDQVIKLTLIVLIISAIVGLYVGALDYAFTKMLELLISI